MDEHVIHVTQTLLDELAPQRERDQVKATLARASWEDVFALIEREDVIKAVTAVVVALAAVAAAIVAYATRKIGTEVAIAILVVAVSAAALTARAQVRDALKPKCK